MKDMKQAVYLLLGVLLLSAGFALGQNNNDSIQTKLKEFEISWEEEDFEKSIGLGEDLLESTTDTNFMNVASKVAYTYNVIGKHDEAIDLLLEAKEVGEAYKGGPSLAFVDVLSELGYSYKKANQLKKGLALLLQAKKICEENFGEKNESYINIAANLAMLYEGMGDDNNALKFYKKAATIAKPIYGGLSSDYSVQLMNLASHYSAIGAFELAEPLINKTIEIEGKVNGKKQIYYAGALKVRGKLRTSMGLYELAEGDLIEALEITKAAIGTSNSTFIVTQVGLAELYAKKGDYSLAIKFTNEILVIIAEKLGVEHPFYIRTKSNLATYYRATSNKRGAIKIYLENIETLERKKQTKSGFYILTINNLAAVYHDLKDNENAEKYYTKALVLAKKIYGTESLRTAITMQGVAKILAVSGKYEAAEKLHIEALQIKLKLVGEHHPKYLLGLTAFGEFYQEKDDFDKARSYYNKSILLNCKNATFDSLSWVKNPDNIIGLDFVKAVSLVKPLFHLYEMKYADYEKSGDLNTLKEGYQLLRTLLGINEQQRDALKEDEDKLQSLERNTIIVEQAIKVGQILGEKVGPNYYEESFTFAELNKSILLADATQAVRAKSLSNLPDSLTLKELELDKTLDVLKRKEVEAKEGAAKNALLAEINELTLEKDAFIKLLKSQYPEYHALKYENISTKAKEIQSLLDDKSLFLEYFVSSKGQFLFVITKEKIDLINLSLDRKLLGAKISDFRKALSDYRFISKERKEADLLYCESAYWLYENLIAKALEAKEISRLIIVADGELGHIPFEAFLTKSLKSVSDYKTLPYLINDYDINYNYSASLWKESKTGTKPKRPASGKMLAAAAAYPEKTDETIARSSRAEQLRFGLIDLPAAKEEVENLSKLYKGNFLLDTATSERYFKEHASEYDIIHLAMHGLLNTRRPILSSLAFTEVPDSTEDNFLEAWEIARLDLNAQLVVLSACETGYGKFQQGEGVLSLARSFMYAGVPSLVVSMWQVNDASTSLIMQNFYEALAKGLDKPAALRQAKLNYLKKAEGVAAHPAFWAPFIQIGNSDAIKLRTKGGNPILWIVLSCSIGLILIAAVVYFRNRKRANS